MLTIGQKQTNAIAQVMHDVFIKKLAKHLKKVSFETGRKPDVNFLSQASIKRLKSRLNDLLDNGFYEELDLASALELIEIFISDKNISKAKVIISKDNTPISQKLDYLWALTRKGEV